MKTLKINLSYHCTARCDHCRFNCDNAPVRGEPDFKTPVRVAKTLKERFGLEMAVVLGGEPSLFADRTHRLMRELDELGLITRIETNASWATTQDEAVEFLLPLKESNTRVMLSLDGFHDPYVSVEKVANAINACVRLGMRFNLELPYLDVTGKEHPVDHRTSELFEAIKSKIDIEIPRYEGNVLFIGRAARRFGDEFAKGRGVPKAICEKVPWWSNGWLEDTQLLILEPGGYITKGCGIAIGNVHKQDLAQMVENYHARENPIFAVLLEQGPYGLARMAQEYGYKLKADYADKCHLCQEARQVLRPYYPGILEPQQHYIQD